MNIVKINNTIKTKRENLILRLSFRFGSELGRSLLGSAYFFDLEFKGPVLGFLKNDVEGFRQLKINTLIFSNLTKPAEVRHRNFTHDELVKILRNPLYEGSFDALSQNKSFMNVYSEIHKFRTYILLQERNKVTGSSIFTSESAQRSMQLKDMYSKRRRKIVTIALREMDSELNSCITNFINMIDRKIQNKSEIDVNDPLFSISKELKHSLNSKDFKDSVKTAFPRYVSDYLSINLYKYIDFEEAGKLLPKKIGFYKYDFTFISIALGILKISEENKLIDDLIIEFSRNYLQFYIDEFNKKASAEKTKKALMAKKTKKIPITIHHHKPNNIQGSESTTNFLPPDLENIVQQIQLKDPNSSFAKNLSKAYNRSKQFTVPELIDILSDYFDESTIEQFVDVMDNYGMVFVNDKVTSISGIEPVVDVQENQTIDNQFGLGISIINELQGLLVGNTNISHHHIVYFYREAGFIFDDEDLFLSQCEVMAGSNTNSMYKKLLKYLLYPDNYQLKYYTHNHNKTKVCVMDLWNGYRIIFIRCNNQEHRVVMIGNHDLYMYYLDRIKKGLYV